MKLKRDQIIKAFEICRDQDLCNECLYEENVDCLRLKEKHAIELMKSQGQKIDELTEENDGLIKALDKSDEAYRDLWGKYEEVAKDNVALHASCTELAQECKKWQGRLKIECEYTKATTIKEFADRLKKYYSSFTGKTSTVLTAYHIDQIATEMLGGDGNASNQTL